MTHPPTPPRIVIPTRQYERKNMMVQYVAEYHLRLLLDFAAVPIMVASMPGMETHLDMFLDGASGLLMMEGKDVHPRRYGTSEQSASYVVDTEEERDEIEFRMFEAAAERDMPILGICRGSHIMNTASGGTMWTDVHQDRPEKSLNHIWYEDYHGYRHDVKIVDDTPLHDIYQIDTLPVNSYHHQAIRKLAPRFTPMAYCTDGVIEAFYDPTEEFMYGIQFHPERMRGEHPGNPKVFEKFVEAAKHYHEKNHVAGRQVV